MSCLISVVSVEWMSSLFFIGGDRADPMPGKKERQGRSANIFSRWLIAEAQLVAAMAFLVDIRQNVNYLLPCRRSRGYMKKTQTDLLQGTLDLLVLKTLQSGPTHGWDIAQRIQQVS